MTPNESTQIDALVARVKSTLGSDGCMLQTLLQEPLGELRAIQETLSDRFERLSERKQESEAGQLLEAEASAVEEYADAVQEVIDTWNSFDDAKSALENMEVSV